MKYSCLDPSLIRRFEEVSNNAWPSVESFQYDGWILRFAGGVTRRSNSVSMLYPSTIDPAVKIDFCETFYRSRQIYPCFKVTGISCPEGIDRLLESRGYFINAVISFQLKSLENLVPEEYPGLTLSVTEDPGWIDEFIRMNGFDPARKPIYRKIMDGILTPRCMATVKQDGETIAVGLGVLEDRYLGLFDIVTDPRVRQQGWGTAVTQTLMGWGKSKGAQVAYLQVLDNNIPALRLYRKLGFSESYRYWYRVKG